MALVRDPLFWHRFSLAVHLDEEAKASMGKNEDPVLSYVYCHYSMSSKKYLIWNRDTWRNVVAALYMVFLASWGF